jgi:pimeloyl-[acyl-carrier protein] synthase
MQNASIESQQADLDHLLEDSSFYGNPYPTFARLRAENPIYWHKAAQTWLISRYDDIDFILRSPKLFSNYGFQNAFFENLRPELRSAAPTLELRGRSPSILTSDPPAHTRLRRLLNTVFSPKAIADLRPRAQALVDRLLDEVKNEGTIDFVAALAYPLPVMMIADIMGLPREDRDVFKELSANILNFMNRNNPNVELTVEFTRRADSSLARVREYLRGVIAARRRESGNDLISVFSVADFEGDSLTEEELLSNLVLFLVAGHETTTSFIANGILLLARHPEQLQLVRERRELLAPALEEILRFESPVQRQRRVVAEDVELNGVPLSKGQPIEVLLGSANRDENRWDNSEQFDILRKPMPHHAFGRGIHFCIGAPLARLEGDVVFNELLNRFAGFETASSDGPEWVANTNSRTPRSLPVKVHCNHPYNSKSRVSRSISSPVP